MFAFSLCYSEIYDVFRAEFPRRRKSIEGQTPALPVPILLRWRDTELAMMGRISVASYAFAILLGMIRTAGPPMVLRRPEAHPDQHGLLQR
jgi:hypothetical protein